MAPGERANESLADAAGKAVAGSDSLHQHMAGLMRLASEALLTVDNNLCITSCNHGGELIFGYAAEALIGESVDRLIPERFRAQHKAHVDRFVASDRTSLVMSERGEIRALRKDGSEFPAEASIAKSVVGGETGFVMVLRDISEATRIKADLQRAIRAAEQASVAKSLFLATMSHELRTPLNAVIGFASLIERQHFGNDLDRYSGYAADIRRSGEHLLAMINEILDLSRIESGHGQLDLELVSMAELIQDSIVMVRERAFRAGVTIGVNAAPDTPPIRLDRRRIKQVLINLLTNAVKFTPEGGRIDVSVARDRNGIALQVTDTGVGIAPEHMEGLFEPFHQIPEHRGRNPEGIGLGLTIVNRICAQHDGRITITSKPGAGTSVHVWLPIGGPGSQGQLPKPVPAVSQHPSSAQKAR